MARVAFKNVFRLLVLPVALLPLLGISQDFSATTNGLPAPDTTTFNPNDSNLFDTGPFLTNAVKPAPKRVSPNPASAKTGATKAGSSSTAPIAITNQWSFRIGALSDSSPALGTDGTIYFGTFDGKLWALSPDGKPKWTFYIGREIKSSPAVGGDGTLYFGCRNRKLYALGADGKKKWEFKTGAWVDASPALAADGTIYFGSWDKNFYALSPNGSQKWLLQTAGEIDSSPALGANGHIYFGSHDRKFYALEPSGKKAWEFTTGGPIISSPALDKDGAVYFTSVDGFFYALNPDGSLRWRLHTGGMTESSPVIGQNGTLYVGVNHQLWAITPEGQKAWERSNDGLVDGAPLALADGTVCFVSRYGKPLVLSAEGQLKWMTQFLSYGSAAPAVSPNGSLYMPGIWTNYFAFSGSAPLARSPWPKFRGNSRNSGNVR